MSIVAVTFNLPLRQTFDYHWPEAAPPPQTGMRVFAPFQRRKLIGVVVEIKQTSDFDRLKTIDYALDDRPVFGPSVLTLTRWVAEYYFCGWGEVLNIAFPGGLGAKLKTTYHPVVAPEALEGFEKLRPETQQLLQQTDGFTREQWQSLKPTSTETKRLSAWLNQETLSLEVTLERSKTRPKMERWLRLTNPQAELPEVKGKPAKRDLILAHLKQHGAMALSQLKETVPTPNQAVKQLEEKGLVKVFQKRVYRRFLSTKLPEQLPFQTLNEHQAQAFEAIGGSLDEGGFQVFLLHGVTGSGKTEVYLHAVQEALGRGMNSLILVPEISLTPQLVDRFRSRFGDRVAVLHSGMDDGERFDEWSRIWQGEFPIVIGARSAVYAPLDQIGLVVVDEEHDGSFKQDDTPRYHGRDIAIIRASQAKCTVVLGSATPSLESWNNAQASKYRLLSLPKRVHQGEMPEVKVIDLKKHKRIRNSLFFTERMISALRTVLMRKEQALLFLNRRGYAALVRCSGCKEVVLCRDCSLSLVYHRSSNQLQCHRCDFAMPMVKLCPYCRCPELKILGVGTEQVEADLQEMMPQARILRIDGDTLHGKHALEGMLEQIRNHEADIVVGTQLVTKGHDFPNITLVGAILADTSLNIPDFRSAERTFQLLTQVAGRAGRAEKTGEVLIQTYNPEHHSVQCTKNHDYLAFAKEELGMRRDFGYPPYSRMVCITFSSPNLQRAEALAWQCRELMDPWLGREVEVHGPQEAQILKIANRFRWFMLLQANHVKKLHKLLNLTFQKDMPLKLKAEERVVVDVDPLHFP